MNVSDVGHTFDLFRALKVVVIGDVMLDVYYKGRVNRLSPEAPVPVVDVSGTFSRAGGAANVALNCAALGAEVMLASVIGDDEAGNRLLQQVQDDGILTKLLIQSPRRKTTVKSRVFNQDKQVLRFDEEMTGDLETEDEHYFIDVVMRYLQIHKPDVVIFEDYNKGVLKENVIDRILEHCHHIGIFTAVDPKKNNFFRYRNIALFKPNLKEVKEALGQESLSVDLASLDKVTEEIKATFDPSLVMITLAEKGVYYRNGTQAAILEGHKRNVVDVSGAGDTVIAVAAMTYAVTHDAATMAAWGNIAGGLVCEKGGVVPVDAAELREEIICSLADKEKNIR